MSTAAGGAAPDAARQLRRGRLIAVVWVMYLAYALVAVARSEHPPVAKATGYVLVVAFAVVFARSFLALRAVRFGVPEQPAGERYLSLVALAALAAAIVAIGGQDATVTLIYLAQAAVLLLPTRTAWLMVAVIVIASGVAGELVSGWQSSIQNALIIPGLAFAVWGIRRFFDYMRRLEQAQDKLARMAVEQERLRFARDLHDIVGHSLTAVAVKLELARRMLGRDDERVRRELGDAEQLTRQALNDVRATVGGYRALTLAGELVTARSVLEAAGMSASLPQAVDDVPGELRELFGWTVREAVTNVVRHSGANRCQVTVTERSVEVRDDGVGGVGRVPAGHGLAGLRERAESAGGTLVCGPSGAGGGWVVRVEVPG